MKKKKHIVITVIITVIVIVIALLAGRTVYEKNLQKNVDIYISSVSLIENPDDPSDEDTYDLLNRFFNQTVGDICVYYDPEIVLSEAEKSMSFDLNKFNVYKIDIECNKKNSAENKFVLGIITDFCEESKFMYVPCNVSSNICVENSRYYFVSKEYSEEDVKQYLKNTGSLISVYIGKDELRGITEYNKTIFYEPDKAPTAQ